MRQTSIEGLVNHSLPYLVNNQMGIHSQRVAMSIRQHCIHHASTRTRILPCPAAAHSHQCQILTPISALVNETKSSCQRLESLLSTSHHNLTIIAILAAAVLCSNIFAAPGEDAIHRLGGRSVLTASSSIVILIFLRSNFSTGAEPVLF